MRVVLLYLRILKKFDPAFPEHRPYEESSKRFLATYQRFKSQTEHRLVVVNCGQEEHDGMFNAVASTYCTYSGGGFDCGTYQAIVPVFNGDCDLVVCLNTHTYFWREGWLEPIIAAADCFGEGVYGVSASYEQFPHLRTPAIAFTPKVMTQYPTLVDTRQKAADFEAGANNFGLWAALKGYPSLLVTAQGVYPMEHWRKPANIFRRGDQSNVLVWDRHTDLYAQADSTTKAQFERDANGC